MAKVVCHTQTGTQPHPLIILKNINMIVKDQDIPVKRYQLDMMSGELVEKPLKQLFLRGPIPLNWLSMASALPGKTLNLAIGLWWLKGMSNNNEFKLTKKALEVLNVSRDASYDALKRLEAAGLIKVRRSKGSRPTVTIVEVPVLGLS